MKLKNFDWNEKAIDRVKSAKKRYTTYKAYGAHEYEVQPRSKTQTQASRSEKADANFKRECLSSL